jgi:Zn-dependent peptidase ImmA (M78 family)/DNA-binding XRE family transcriptional regulator
MNLIEGREKRALARPIPERFKEAREARGLTVEAFAYHLDVTRQAVAQYETGQIAPSGEVLAKIIALTELPPSFFVSPRERTQHGTPFWRGLKRMDQRHRRRISRRLEWARDIAAHLEQFIQVPQVNIPTIEFNTELDDVEQIEVAAETLRDFWELGRGPIRDLSLTLEKNGIILVCEAVDCRDMDAVSCWQGGRAFILFSSQVTSGPRSLYNLCHELGHILLHAGVEVTSKNLDRIERQANRFAGAFLLPRETFSEEVLGNSISYFKTLKQRWGVAIAAMAYRCKDLKILSANQYAYLLRQMNALRIRKVEPLDDAFPVRSPCLLAESVRMILDHRVQTREQLEGALKLNLRDVESLCGAPSGYLDTKVVAFQPRPREG